ncbi:D-glucosaminate-specific PTS system IIA component [Breznakia blatticola]|uniref:D-glucosaminate-specific PTS system IIA component n=1 Tax=Breznakia blatticola TaxID=1754012 RepID=A0A4R7Z9T1_9FIRM|nr:D-glucosaminate-specific PTS system IIA component [Breznakia blatticola]
MNLNNNDLHILLLTHGKAGEALMESAEMIAGELSNVHALSLMPGTSPETYKEEVKEQLSTFHGDILIFCDIFGGTPSYVAAELATDYKISLLSGLNLAMLLEACLSKTYDNFANFVTKVKEAGDASVVLIQSENT